jgi:hypothetical protein
VPAMPASIRYELPGAGPRRRPAAAR